MHSHSQMSPVPTTDDESDRAQKENRIERHKKGIIRFKFMEYVAGDTALAVHKVEYDKCEECTLPCSLELPWNITNLAFMMFSAEELFPLGAGRAFDLYLKFLKLQTWSAPDLPSHWVSIVCFLPLSTFLVSNLFSSFLNHF